MNIITPHIQRDIHDRHGIRGIVTVSNFELPRNNMQARLIDQFLRNARNIHPARYREAILELHQLCDFRQQIFYNRVHATGRQVLARLLIDDTTYSGEINYGALGSSSAAINDADTTLGTEVARKPIATRSRTGDSITIDFYFSKADTSGTYAEFGTFIDGTDAANSGQMFNRVLTGGWTKSATEAMTVSLQVDINAV